MAEVSIVMPCYNHGKYVSEAIESILDQTYQDFELIIVDDSSTDNSIELIKRYQRADKRVIAVFHKLNCGQAKSRNDAILVASGNYIAFCDSDDVWENNKLSTQLQYFDLYPEHAVIHSDSIIIDGEGKPTGDLFSSLYHKGVQLTGNLFEELCITNFLNTQTVMIRRECLRDAGFFLEDMRYGEDWIYWVKIAQKHTFLFVDKVLARYRVHDSSSCINKEGYAINRIKGYSFILEEFPAIRKEIKSKIFYLLGMEYSWLGQVKVAKKHFIKAVRMDPSNLRAYYRILTS